MATTKKTEVPHYQEWDCKITIEKEKRSGETISVPKYEKLKIKRPRVLISEEQAEILNNGVLTGGNNYGVMYFLPEN